MAKVCGIEGMVARNYWLILAGTFDKKLKFKGRAFGKTGRPMVAVDPINALFNYGYSFLESRCIRAISANGLDPYIGFIHEIATGKSPLAYDLQEPFRWMVDVAVIKSLEQNILTKKDFVRTDNYVIRLRSEGAQKLVRAVHNQGQVQGQESEVCLRPEVDGRVRVLGDEANAGRGVGVAVTRPHVLEVENKFWTWNEWRQGELFN